MINRSLVFWSFEWRCRGNLFRWMQAASGTAGHDNAGTALHLVFYLIWPGTSWTCVSLSSWCGNVGSWETATVQDQRLYRGARIHAARRLQLVSIEPVQVAQCIAVRKVATPLRVLTCHMGSHNVTCHPAEVTFPPLPQPKLAVILDTACELSGPNNCFAVFCTVERNVMF